MHSVFISHVPSEKHKPFTNKLVDCLRSRGYETWIHDDSKGVDTEQEAPKTLIIDTCVMLALIDSGSVESYEVRQEFEWASANQKPIIPLLLEMLSVPKWISQHQSINFSIEDDLNASQEYLLEKLEWMCSDEFRNIRQSINLHFSESRKEKIVAGKIIETISENNVSLYDSDPTLNQKSLSYQHSFLEKVEKRKKVTD